MIQNSNFIQINPMTLSRDDCHLIIRRFLNAEDTPGDFDAESNQFTVHDVENHHFKAKYKDHMGRMCYNMTFENPDFQYMVEKCDTSFPKSEEFMRVSFIQIIEYPDGSFIPFHQDLDEDSATSIVFLNDDFHGGSLICDGIIIPPDQGTMVSFNNSGQRWHGTVPVMGNPRYVLAFWFDRGDIEDFDQVHNA